MIESSYKPILNGDAPSSQQTWYRNILYKIKKIDRSFFISKLFYFCFYTALGGLFPFFSLYYKQLWLSPSQIGILVALRPAVKVICLPLWKVVTDSYSRPRAVYFISIFGWLIGYYGQTLVSPNNVPCYGINSSVVETELSNSSALNASLSDMAVRGLNQPLYDTNKNTLNSFNIKTLDKRASKLSKLLKEDMKLPSQFISIKKLKNSDVDSYSKLSSLTEEDKKMSYELRRPQKRRINDVHNFKDGEIVPDKEEVSIKTLRQNDNDSTKKQGQNTKSRQVSSQDDTITHQQPDDYTDHLFSSQTKKSPRPPNDFRVRYNYWIVRTLAVVIILTEIITSPTPMLADSAVIQSLTDTDNDYGRQRLFGSLGLALSATLVAIWVSHSTDCLYSDTINYLPCFNIFFIAICATVVVSLFFKFEAPDRADEGYKLLEAIKVFKTPRHGFFLFTMFALGYSHSLQITFLFWFLQDMGGSPVLFAFIILVYCISEVVMYFVLGYIIQAIGQQRTLVIGIACYSARFLMYGSLKHPWLVIPMELVQGMTYGGVWMVAGMYINTTEDTAKTVQSILHGMYWGVGMAVGALVSGFVIEDYGAKAQFLVMSLVTAVLCVIHLFIFIADRIKELEDESRARREQPVTNQPITKQPSIKRHKGDQNKGHIIGAAAAPLVPCLLYGQ